MSKAIENLKSGNYLVVDNQGVSVTQHFIECLEKEFSDLEAKLAEMTEKYNACQEARKLEIEFSQQDKAQLKQQLAEKEAELEDWKDGTIVEKLWHLERQLAEKEIEYYKKQAKKFNNEAQKYYEDAYCNDFHNQDKISFCIEKLEKVRNIIESKVENICKRLDDLNIKIVCESTSSQLSTYEEIKKEIDNQIDALRNNKYGKH